MRDSLSDLNHYSVGYVDWNLLVDYNGGEFLWWRVLVACVCCLYWFHHRLGELTQVFFTAE